jgi:hypothetical protein
VDWSVPLSKEKAKIREVGGSGEEYNIIPRTNSTHLLRLMGYQWLTMRT